MRAMIDQVIATQLLPAGTRLGPVHLAVTDRQRAIAFWSGVLGLSVLAETLSATTLGAGARPLVVLRPGARTPVLHGHTGLYHVAIHFPTRKAFAQAMARLFRARVPHSPTDHLVTETTYVSDPDGNGVELTFETPSRGELITLPTGEWAGRTPEGRLTSGRDPLDLDSVFEELEDDEVVDVPVPAGARVGHVHLHVGEVDRALRFYVDVVGFRAMLHAPRYQFADAGIDVAVPHTMAFNTWAGVGAPPPPADAAGLRQVTLELPDASGLEALSARLAAHGTPVDRDEDGLHFLDPYGHAVLAATS